MWPLRPRPTQPDARSVGQPEPAAFGLLMRDLKPLALPDTLDPLVVDCPARLAQQFGDLAIAIAAVLPLIQRQIGDCLAQPAVLERPAAASRRSLQACIVSLPLQSSSMSKTYLKSDHFNGGGSTASAQQPPPPATTPVVVARGEWVSVLFAAAGRHDCRGIRGPRCVAVGLCLMGIRV